MSIKIDWLSAKDVLAELQIEIGIPIFPEVDYRSKCCKKSGDI